MAVTVTSLKTNNPEFSKTSDVLIQDKIDTAKLNNDVAVLGDKYDKCVELYACYLISESPMGFANKLTKKTENEYYMKWKRFAKPAAQAYNIWG